jgi:hypothetical protein
MKNANTVDPPVDEALPRHSRGSAVDLRWLRYARWLDECLTGYPEGLSDNADWEFGVRFLSVLDCASLLLSDQELDRLLRLLEHLDASGPLVPRPAAARLMRLGERDFFWFLARLMAIAVADLGASLEDMAAVWRQGFCFQAQPEEPTGALSPNGAFHAYEKPYRDRLIDRDLDEVQMDRLNAVPGIEVTGTCAGHPERSSSPSFCYSTARGEVVIVDCEIANTGRNGAELRTWWEEAISRVEREGGDGTIR